MNLNVADGPFRLEPNALTAPGKVANAREVQLPLLAQYVSILRRRKWAVIAALAISILAGLVITMLSTPQYTASATLEIQREDRGLVDVEVGNRAVNSTDMEFYQTQYGLLRSESLAERVAVSLRLYNDAKFFETFGHPGASQWFANGQLVAGAPSRETRIQEAGRILLSRVVVVPERLSRLVTIHFSSPDPALSARIANAWTDNFIESTIDRRFEASSYARTFLEERLGQLRQRIDEAERSLVSYAARESIINLPTATDSGANGKTIERSLVAEDLVRLNEELAKATADRILAQSRLQAGGDVAEVLNNQAISGMRERRTDLAAQYANMMVQFEPTYPPAQALQMQIDELDKSIQREEQRVNSTLRETYQATQQRESQLQARVNQLKSGMLDLRERSIQYNILQRDADTNRELYDAMLQRYKEIGVAGGVGINNIAVVDEAKVPQSPSSPNMVLNLLIAIFAGLFVGVAAAITLEHLDHGVIDPSEIEKLFGLPLLGTIPRVQSEELEDALNDPKSWVSEAYLALQTNLSFSTDHGLPRSLAVTSTRASEGKSSTAYAIARAIVRQRRRVILIDSDMRSPRIHARLGISNSAGLSNYLSGQEDYPALIRTIADEELKVMTAGPLPPSAPELLSTDRFALLIERLSADFDHIVIDCPPVMGLADAPLIADQVEGMVFVVEAQKTSRKMIEVALGRLRAARSQIFGIVLTKFDPKRVSLGYGYEYGYGYGYGATIDGKTKRSAEKHAAE
jgi:capsular exopolysaccharide synthesis family protein